MVYPQVRIFCIFSQFITSAVVAKRPINLLLLGAVNVTAVDAVNDVMGLLSVDGASHGLGRAQDLLHDAAKVLGHGPGSHDSGGIDDVVHGDVAVVLDILHLLTVTWGLLKKSQRK